MSRRAWAYICGVLLVGAMLSGLSFLGFVMPADVAPAFVILTTLATLAQLLKVEAPNQTLYHATPVFLFAGVLLLPPALYVLLVLIPFLTEWARERWINSSYLRAWYLQPFNISMYLIVGFSARWVYGALTANGLWERGAPAVLAATIAVLVYAVANHILLALALVLARGLSWYESGLMDTDNLLTELVLAYLGYIVAALWHIDPWLLLPALAPLLLIQRALKVPQLRKEAQTDVKTGLLNARHFAKLFANELDRARRFKRPIAVIMADLDMMRNINNTYGHLAGDAVLEGVGKIIRESIRDYDIAGRFGGEEFAIVMPESGRTEAQIVAERIRRKIEAARFDVTTCATAIRATMSFGIACFPTDAATTLELTNEADAAVYQAKLNGRNCVVCAEDVPNYFSHEKVYVE